MQTYLIDCRFDLKEVKRFFALHGPNRLDHKEFVSTSMFFLVDATFHMFYYSLKVELIFYGGASVHGGR